MMTDDVSYAPCVVFFSGVVPLTVNDGGLAASLTNTEHICGVVYAITQTSITIWSPNKNSKILHLTVYIPNGLRKYFTQLHCKTYKCIFVKKVK